MAEFEFYKVDDKPWWYGKPGYQFDSMQYDLQQANNEEQAKFEADFKRRAFENGKKVFQAGLQMARKREAEKAAYEEAQARYEQAQKLHDTFFATPIISQQDATRVAARPTQQEYERQFAQQQAMQNATRNEQLTTDSNLYSSVPYEERVKQAEVEDWAKKQREINDKTANVMLQLPFWLLAPKAMAVYTALNEAGRFAGDHDKTTANYINETFGLGDENIMGHMLVGGLGSGVSKLISNGLRNLARNYMGKSIENMTMREVDELASRLSSEGRMTKELQSDFDRLFSKYNESFNSGDFYENLGMYDGLPVYKIDARPMYGFASDSRSVARNISAMMDENGIMREFQPEDGIVTHIESDGLYYGAEKLDQYADNVLRYFARNDEISSDGLKTNDIIVNENGKLLDANSNKFGNFVPSDMRTTMNEPNTIYHYNGDTGFSTVRLNGSYFSNDQSSIGSAYISFPGRISSGKVTEIFDNKNIRGLIEDFRKAASENGIINQTQEGILKNIKAQVAEIIGKDIEIEPKFKLSQNGKPEPKTETPKATEQPIENEQSSNDVSEKKGLFSKFSNKSKTKPEIPDDVNKDLTKGDKVRLAFDLGWNPAQTIQRMRGKKPGRVAKGIDLAYKGLQIGNTVNEYNFMDAHVNMLENLADSEENKGNYDEANKLRAEANSLKWKFGISTGLQYIPLLKGTGKGAKFFGSLERAVGDGHKASNWIIPTRVASGVGFGSNLFNYSNDIDDIQLENFKKTQENALNNRFGYTEDTEPGKTVVISNEGDTMMIDNEIIDGFLN